MWISVQNIYVCVWINATAVEWEQFTAWSARSDVKTVPHQEDCVQLWEVELIWIPLFYILTPHTRSAIYEKSQSKKAGNNWFNLKQSNVFKNL